MDLLSAFKMGASNTALAKSGVTGGVKTLMGTTSTKTTKSTPATTKTKELSDTVKRLYSYTPIQRGIQFSTAVRLLQTDPSSVKAKQLTNLSLSAKEAYVDKAVEKSQLGEAITAATPIIPQVDHLATVRQGQVQRAATEQAENLAQNLAITLNNERESSSGGWGWSWPSLPDIDLKTIAVAGGVVLGAWVLASYFKGGRK